MQQREGGMEPGPRAVVSPGQDAPRMNAPWPVADERALVRRCQAGERGARRELVVRHERAVFALLSRLTGAGPHVEDLAQETFLRAFAALDGFDPEGPARLSTWLLTIATRLGLDARKRRVLPTDPLEPGLTVADGDDPEQQTERARLGRAIAAAAAQLGDDQRAAFLLLDLHGLSVAEVAHATGVPENTVKQRAFRAREKLRSLLGALRPGALS
ncbi:MAG: sigma-70 family RNA polymerase sigma factor [Myxococcales bacterium]|nr:MAG: sigma-70 family RNA polymerase sigma factor [Myxococcales bacterium]